MAKIKEALENSTDHLVKLNTDAVPNIVRAKNNFLKFLWLLLFVTSCGCIYLILSAVLQFKEYKVITTVRYMSETVPTTPTMMHCSVVPFTSDFALDLLIKANVSQTYANGEPIDYWRQYLEIEDYMMRTRGSYLTLAEKLNLQDFGKMIPGSTSSSYTVNNPGPPYEYIFHPKFYGCVRSNIYGNRSVNLDNKITRMIFYQGGANQNITQIYQNNVRGIYMFFQNSTDYPYGTDRTPLLVSPNTYYTVNILSRRFYEQHLMPYSGCSVLEDEAIGIDLEDRYIFDQVIETGYKYTQKTCFTFCTQLMTTQKCGCNSKRTLFKVEGVEKECSLSDELNCVEKVWNSLNEINTFCYPKCPLECSRSHFDLNINLFSDGPLKLCLLCIEI